MGAVKKALERKLEPLVAPPGTVLYWLTLPAAPSLSANAIRPVLDRCLDHAPARIHVYVRRDRHDRYCHGRLGSTLRCPTVPVFEPVSAGSDSYSTPRPRLRLLPSATVTAGWLDGHLNTDEPTTVKLPGGTLTISGSTISGNSGVSSVRTMAAAAFGEAGCVC